MVQHQNLCHMWDKEMEKKEKGNPNNKFVYIPGWTMTDFVVLFQQSWNLLTMNTNILKR